MEVVIVQTQGNKERVRQICDHVFSLDGTRIKVVTLSNEDGGKFKPLYKNNFESCKRAFLFHHAASQMNEAFVYLRPIYLPKKSGWMKKLMQEYKKCGKEILCTKDGGIGVYPAESKWLIPKDLKTGEMADWIFKYLGPVSAELKNSFERIKPETPVKRSKTFHHCGDIGDCVSMLPTMRKLGGGHLTLGNHPRSGDGYFHPIKGMKYEALKPLLEAQPYVLSVTYEEQPKVDHDFTDFRKIPHRKDSLLHAQAIYMKTGFDFSPWLSCEPDKEMKDRVVIARSPRYQSMLFPWEKVVQTYGERILFVGLKDEHKEFEKYVNSKVEYRKTENLLEVANLMMGSRLVICNQTSAFWVAAGLGCDTILEESNFMPNCRIPRLNIQYIAGDNVELPKL